MPEQPIPFDHQLHAGTLQMDCLYCHSQADKGPHATVPSVSTCMNCHTEVQTKDEHGELKPAIAEPLFRLYEDSPELSGPEDVWKHARLVSLTLRVPSETADPQFTLAYTFEWDEWQVIQVSLFDWSVTRVDVAGAMG